MITNPFQFTPSPAPAPSGGGAQFDDPDFFGDENPFDAGDTDPYASPADANPYGQVQNPYESTAAETQVSPYGNVPDEEPEVAFPDAPFDPAHGTATIGHAEDDVELDFGESGDQLNPFNL